MLPPTIPTSFVPHSASATSRRSNTDFIGIFGFISYAVLSVAFVLAIGVFFYGQILSSSKVAKDAELAEAQSAINPTTVEEFVKLRDRLSLGKTLLESHTAFSGFFSSLGILIPSTIRFSSLHLSIGDKGTIKFDGSGVAKSFNALAAASMAFAQDGRIKDAIFSNIIVDSKDNSVSFSLVASLDPKLVAFSPNASIAAPSMPITTATTTP